MRRQRASRRRHRNNRQCWPLLDRTQPDPSLNAEDASPSLVPDDAAVDDPPARGWQRPLGWLRRAGQFFFALSFSSLTRRIVSLNLAGLIALVASILYLSQFRAGLIDARAQSLLVQAEIIARRDRRLRDRRNQHHHHRSRPAARPEARRNLRRRPDEFSGLDFPINPERVAPVLRRPDLADQDPRPHLRPRRRADPRQPQPYGRGDVLRFELPPPSAEKPGIAERTMIAIRTWLNRGDLPLYRELGPENGKGYQRSRAVARRPEGSMVRINERGEVIVSVAVPVQRFRAVHRRADAVDAGRRHRPDGHRRAARHPESRSASLPR